MSNQQSGARWHWNGPRLRAAKWLAEGYSREQVARETGISERTLYRWLNIPEFISQIKADSAKFLEENPDFIADLSHLAPFLRDSDEDTPLFCVPPGLTSEERTAYFEAYSAQAKAIIEQAIKQKAV